MAIAFVSSNKGTESAMGQTNYNIGPINTAAGNLIIVSPRSAYQRIVSISDTAGNTYVPSPSYSALAPLWYAKNAIANASNTVTLHFSPADDYVEACVWQYSGLDLVNPLDAYNGKHYNGSTTIASDPFTTIYAEELIFCVLDVESGGNTWTPGSGYTLRNSGLGNQIVVGQEKIVSAIQTSVIASAVTSVSSSVYKGISVATFTAPISRGGSSPMFFGGGVEPCLKNCSSPSLSLHSQSEGVWR